MTVTNLRFVGMESYYWRREEGLGGGEGGGGEREPGGVGGRGEAFLKIAIGVSELGGYGARLL